MSTFGVLLAIKSTPVMIAMMQNDWHGFFGICEYIFLQESNHELQY